ncbi:MAG: LysR family transcriptional regulator [Anaerotardibacter sp.]
MNLSQLYYFRKLAELQHYTKSAKELFITQPTLSGSISSLEQELGVSLFQKKGRNVQLTKYGAEFLTYVNASLEQLDKGIAIMKGYSGESDGGTIDLGCIITVQVDFVPKIMNEFRKNCEHRHDFNIAQKTSSVLLESLTQGKHDVVFCARDDSFSDVIFVPVVEQEVIVVTNQDSPLVEKEFITPEDLVGQKIISYRDSIPLGKSMKGLFDSLGVENSIKYAFDDETILAGFAVNGISTAVMVDTFFIRKLDDAVIRPLVNNAKEKKRFYHTIYLAYSDKNYRPYCVDSFIEYVEGHQLDRNDENKIYFD